MVGVYDEASTQVFNCGIPNAVAYFSKEHRYTEAELLGSAVRFGFLALPLSALTAAAVVRWPLQDLDTATRVFAFLLVALSPLANTFGIAARLLLTARADLAGLRTTTLVQSLFRFALLCGAFFTGSLNVTSAVAIIAFANYVGNVYAIDRCHVRPRGHAPLRLLLGYGIRALPGSMSNLVNNRLDQIIIAPLLGMNQLGFYAVAANVSALPVQVGSGLAAQSFSRTKTADTALGHAATEEFLRRAWVVCVGLTAGLALAIPAIPLVYGNEFSGAVVPALVLLPGSIAFAVNQVAQQVANGVGRPQYGSTGQVAGVVATAILLPPAIVYLGIAGAAMASSVAYAVRLAVTMRLLRKVGIRDTSPRWSDVASLTADLVALGKTVGRRANDRARRRPPV